MSGERKFDWIAALAVAAILALPVPASAQSTDRTGWVEEPGAKVEGQPGRAYLDPASVHRGTDGMVYFNESSGVTRSEDIGKVGIMLDAYDCAKNVKYMCVQYGNWRNDAKSMLNAARDRRCGFTANICAATQPPPTARDPKRAELHLDFRSLRSRGTSPFAQPGQHVVEIGVRDRFAHDVGRG